MARHGRPIEANPQAEFETILMNAARLAAAQVAQASARHVRQERTRLHVSNGERPYGHPLSPEAMAESSRGWSRGMYDERLRSLGEEPRKEDFESTRKVRSVDRRRSSSTGLEYGSILQLAHLIKTRCEHAHDHAGPVQHYVMERTGSIQSDAEHLDATNLVAAAKRVRAALVEHRDGAGSGGGAAAEGSRGGRAAAAKARPAAAPPAVGSMQQLAAPASSPAAASNAGLASFGMEAPTTSMTVALAEAVAALGRNGEISPSRFAGSPHRDAAAPPPLTNGVSSGGGSPSRFLAGSAGPSPSSSAALSEAAQRDLTQTLAAITADLERACIIRSRSPNSPHRAKDETVGWDSVASHMVRH
eukprot:TRINITY_DN22725_c0_g1_i1.p2 TRINITY_DN22725_c0_g1~~TRINITY_DN22725_c0_g1_i1.p2  ORF type:complete len:360 (+),score=76.19 TRINITY_DN22725_c0_g1_i1:61-1140(+)